jgi:hypothetical protein
MDFWQYFWLIVWWFLFFAYLMMLFTIFADIFRDHELGGWGKALWCLFLIFFPFLGALVYLIARGGSMGKRSLKQAQDYQAAQAEYIRNVAATGAAAPSAADQIHKAKELLDSGTITQQEFDAIKAKALA